MFGFFSYFYLSQELTRYDVVAFVLIIAAAAVSCFSPGWWGWGTKSPPAPPSSPEV